MADDLESLAHAIARFIVAVKSKARPAAKQAVVLGSPRTGRERPPTTDEIYKACLVALSVDERASLAGILGKMHRAIGDLPDEILEPRQQRRP